VASTASNPSCASRYDSIVSITDPFASTCLHPRTTSDHSTRHRHHTRLLRGD
jgi:hypothetical protein